MRRRRLRAEAELIGLVALVFAIFLILLGLRFGHIGFLVGGCATGIFAINLLWEVPPKGGS